MTDAAARAEQLFAGLVATPDNDGQYLVYADALAAIGDPRAELIVSMSELAAAGDAAERARLGAVVDACVAKLQVFGELARHPRIAWDFRLGFLRSASILPSWSRDKTEDLVTKILGLPSACLLRELAVYDDYEPTRQRVNAAFAAANPPPTLTGVTFPTKYMSLAEALAQRESARWFAMPAEMAKVPPELLELDRLVALHVSSTVSTIPAEIGQLKRLCYLDVAGCNRLYRLPEEVFGIESLTQLEFRNARLSYHVGRMTNLLDGFARARTPSRQRMIESALLLQYDRRVRELAGVPELLAALDSNVAEVRDAAKLALAARVRDPFAKRVGPKSSFALIGTTSFSRDRIARELAVRDVAFTAKIDDTTTHVIVGDEPGGKHLQIGTRKVVLESHFKAWLEATPAAKPAKPAKKPAKAAKEPVVEPVGDPVPVDIERVRAIFAARDDATTLAAIVSLGTRVPPELYADLVVVTMEIELAKSRNAAKKLLATGAPSSITDALKTHVKASLLIEMGTEKRANRIDAFCRDAKVVDANMLALLIALRVSWQYAYTIVRQPPAGVVRMLAARLVDGVLSLRHESLEAVPPQIAELPQIVAIDVSHNRLASWPETVHALPALERLELVGNKIETVPPTVSALRLTRLDLERNPLRGFPEAVLSIATLEDLDVSTYEYVSSQIPAMPEAIGTLARLRRLAYRWHPIERFPDSLFTLRELAELDLTSCKLPPAIPPELASLTALRMLRISKTSWVPLADELKRVLPDCEIDTTSNN